MLLKYPTVINFILFCVEECVVFKKIFLYLHGLHISNINNVHARRMPSFLKSLSCGYACVCPSPMPKITTGMI